jgi:hypothetical protein
MNKNRQIIECIDCEKKTSDFYQIANNRGKLYKCKQCYELGLTRSSRNDYTYKDVHYTANSIKR